MKIVKEIVTVPSTANYLCVMGGAEFAARFRFGKGKKRKRGIGETEIGRSIRLPDEGTY
jgi:hypothetical protein